MDGGLGAVFILLTGNGDGRAREGRALSTMHNSGAVVPMPMLPMMGDDPIPPCSGIAAKGIPKRERGEAEPGDEGPLGELATRSDNRGLILMLGLRGAVPKGVLGSGEERVKGKA